MLQSQIAVLQITGQEFHRGNDGNCHDAHGVCLDAHGDSPMDKLICEGEIAVPLQERSSCPAKKFFVCSGRGTIAVTWLIFQAHLC